MIPGRSKYMALSLTSEGASFSQIPKLMIEPPIAMLDQLTKTQSEPIASYSSAAVLHPMTDFQPNHKVTLLHLITKTTIDIATANNCLPYMIVSAKGQQQMVNKISLVFYYKNPCANF